MYDPWVVMTAIALRTSTVTIGALVTPPARRRPWKLASQVATVDQISLVLRDGRTVVWGSAEDSDAKAEVLVELLEQPARKYDVSVPGQPTTSG